MAALACDVFVYFAMKITRFEAWVLEALKQQGKDFAKRSDKSKLSLPLRNGAAVL
ncbi:unnamed protein product [Ilex paraguariensis]|uniref:Uncharacterized protein n=1 Tax=Ilex paraguariensis TaxID=185542 RepID=A0ABC8TA93_9AQUA